MSGLSPGLLPRARFLGAGRWRRRLAHFDWVLFGAVLLLAVIGLVNLYSATHDTAHSAKFSLQLRWMVIGFGAFFAVTAIDFHTWHRLAWFGLGFAILALLAVHLFGDASKGAARWLVFGAVRIQPSELAKIVVIIAMARLLHDRGTGDLRLGDSLGLLVAIVLPVLIVATQPDLGTASLLALIILSVSLLMSKRTMEIGIGIGGMIALLPLLWEVMHDYQKARVLAFIDPSADPTGSGWHAQQSILAVGSGQLTGKGM
ncbi:MAG: FtsW/RodA/SpoVE family cell cycle protein, partial [Deltaproteobacteria bacterium]|nr:FtsW/RodA/SpoVE family cell cycle protein [Deltaproteobacteria bacterium]